MALDQIAGKACRRNAVLENEPCEQATITSAVEVWFEEIFENDGKFGPLPSCRYLFKIRLKFAKALLVYTPG